MADNDGLNHEEYPYFVGPCTCKPDCPSFEDDEKHGWGSCDEEGCECKAGWEE